MMEGNNLKTRQFQLIEKSFKPIRLLMKQAEITEKVQFVVNELKHGRPRVNRGSLHMETRFSISGSELLI